MKVQSTLAHAQINSIYDHLWKLHQILLSSWKLNSNSSPKNSLTFLFSVSRKMVPFLDKIYNVRWKFFCLGWRECLSNSCLDILLCTIVPMKRIWIILVLIVCKEVKYGYGSYGPVSITFFFCVLFTEYWWHTKSSKNRSANIWFGDRWSQWLQTTWSLWKLWSGIVWWLLHFLR